METTKRNAETKQFKEVNLIGLSTKLEFSKKKNIYVICQWGIAENKKSMHLKLHHELLVQNE